MKIDSNKCVMCKMCLDCCPAEAIIEAPDESIYISEDLCFECGVCQRLMVCQENAIVESEAVKTYPRVVRALFSDPNCTHECTKVPGRGTEESKTNDVTGRIKRGDIGICVEFGRPGLGCTFKDISCMTARLVRFGLRLEPNNPLTVLMDSETGYFPDELLTQRILSAIIEVKVNADELEDVIPVIIEVGQNIDTVFSLGVICRFEENGDLPILARLKKLGVAVAPNAKINLGTGRPLMED